jgi:phosphoribosylaminoimidazole-succinocarboxamide synthase
VRGGTVCGIPLPPGLDRASQLPLPIFTPATKAEQGHDENVDFATVSAALGTDLAEALRGLTLDLYREGAGHATARNLILADTKFEFGHALDTGELMLIDEVLTPDSSRYWDIANWLPGTEPTSFDKQFVRNWLDESGWDKESTPPELPDDVVRGTFERYLQAFQRLTGREPVL